MSDPEAELDRLFDEMANVAVPPEPTATEAHRRQRAIGGMRAMRRAMTDGDGAPRLRRSYVWLVAAAAAAVLCGTALAATRGLLHFSLHDPIVTGSGKSATASTHRDGAGAPAPISAVAPALGIGSATAIAPATETAGPADAKVGHAKGSAELQEVNRLFIEAKRARREHRDTDALSLLQQLLTKHPGSVLAHEATVERFRALARLGRTAEAERYARAYLVHYPTGFAADEARALTDGSLQ